MKASYKYVYQRCDIYIYRTRNIFLAAKDANKNKAELPLKWFYSHYSLGN